MLEAFWNYLENQFARVSYRGTLRGLAAAVEEVSGVAIEIPALPAPEVEPPKSKRPTKKNPK